MRKVIDLTGQAFGKWTVLYRSANTKNGNATWYCRCECGTERSVQAGRLRIGESQSCGCIPKRKLEKHGMSYTREYSSWRSMITRCTNPRAKIYSRYGGKGITICERWYNVENFYADMGKRPEGTSLDRIDNGDGYHCGHCEDCKSHGWKANCRWATVIAQNSNTRKNRYVMLNDERLTMSEYARRVGVDPATVYDRIESGKLKEAP